MEHGLNGFDGSERIRKYPFDPFNPCSIALNMPTLRGWTPKLTKKLLSYIIKLALKELEC